MFENQPKGLYALALANTGERFGYYTMLAVFALFLRANYGLDAGWAGEIYSDFLMLVYFLPIVGGWLADRFGFGRMVTIGILIMFAGYLLLSVPLGGDKVALVVMLAALVLIGLGTGLFKGNLQVMVGDLYNDPQYAGQRDQVDLRRNICEYGRFYKALHQRRRNDAGCGIDQVLHGLPELYAGRPEVRENTEPAERLRHL